MVTNWNLADCLDRIAELRGDRQAIIQGEVEITWRSFRARAESIAVWLIEQGLGRGSKVALYTYNDIAYLETTYACLQAGMIPVNINYRYQPEELRYLLDNSDAQAVLVHAEFVPRLAEVLPSLPALASIILLDSPAPPGSLAGHAAEHYESITAVARSYANDQRSADDLVFIYTGGTTGMPKGVMWRQGDLYYSLAGGTVAPPPETRAGFEAFIRDDVAPLRALVLPPLMHATAFFAALTVLLAGGTVILSSSPKRFDPAEALRLIERHRPNALSIVGDVFARPLLEELGRQPYDISSLAFISSAGTLWSQEVKAGLIALHPELRLVDGLGSTEAHGIGASITTRETVDGSAPRFTFGRSTFLVDENLEPLAVAPGARGLIAVEGRRPLGYYKDDRKSRDTFTLIDGRPCTLSGDWVEVNEDGETFTLLGRGSLCINTGGEKVYPEEVETAINEFPSVTDALVVGVPSRKWGEAVAAVVATRSGSLDVDELASFLRTRLATYKVPKHFIEVAEVYRGPSGKADYQRTRQLVLERIEPS